MDKEEVYNWLVDVSLTFDDNKEEAIRMLDYLIKRLKEELTKNKLIEELERLRFTSDEELRTKYPLRPQVGTGIDWEKWIEENLKPKQR